jgi:hypothetical protein
MRIDVELLAASLTIVVVVVARTGSAVVSSLVTGLRSSRGSGGD